MKPLGICVGVWSVREGKGSRIALRFRGFIVLLFQKSTAGGRAVRGWKLRGVTLLMYELQSSYFEGMEVMGPR